MLVHTPLLSPVSLTLFPNAMANSFPLLRGYTYSCRPSAHFKRYPREKTLPSRNPSAKSRAQRTHLPTISSLPFPPPRILPSANVFGSHPLYRPVPASRPLEHAERKTYVPRTAPRWTTQEKTKPLPRARLETAAQRVIIWSVYGAASTSASEAGGRAGGPQRTPLRRCKAFWTGEPA